MCMYIYVCMYVCICINVCIYMYKCTYVYHALVGLSFVCFGIYTSTFLHMRTQKYTEVLLRFNCMRQDVVIQMYVPTDVVIQMYVPTDVVIQMYVPTVCALDVVIQMYVPTVCALDSCGRFEMRNRFHSLCMHMYMRLPTLHYSLTCEECSHTAHTHTHTHTHVHT